MARIYTQNRGFQVKARAHKITTTQAILHNLFTRVILNSTDFDPNNNLDITIRTGTATSTLANHLVDTGATFGTSDVGAKVWNTTDNTYAIVTARNSATDVTLDTDIMVIGETYTMYASKFVCPIDGVYSVKGSISFEALVDACYAVARIMKNHTTMIAQQGGLTGGPGTVDLEASVIDQFAANDIITLEVYQTSGVTKNLIAAENTSLSIQLLSR